jgi:hypothetical protein
VNSVYRICSTSGVFFSPLALEKKSEPDTTDPSHLDNPHSDAGSESTALLSTNAEQSDMKASALIKATQFDAAFLRLGEIQSEADKNWATAQQFAVKNSPVLGSSSLDTIEDYIDVLENRDGEVKAEGDINSRYLAFHNALNELLVRIQALIGTGSSGDRLDIPGKKIFNEIFQFMWDHHDDTVGGPYDSREEAEIIAKQFKQGTIEVDDYSSKDGPFYLKPSYSALDSLVPCLVDEDKRSTMLIILDIYSVHDISDPDDFWDGDSDLRPFVDDGSLEHALISSGRASQIQAVQLALEDIRKIHETETQFCLETYNRQLTQFNNLVKMFSAFMEGLVQNLKGFL